LRPIHPAARGAGTRQPARRLVVDQPLGKTEDVQARLWLAVDPTAVYLLPAAP